MKLHLRLEMRSWRNDGRARDSKAEQTSAAAGAAEQVEGEIGCAAFVTSTP